MGNGVCGSVCACGVGDENLQLSAERLMVEQNDDNVGPGVSNLESFSALSHNFIFKTLLFLI